MKSKIAAGAISGLVAGFAMAVGMMMYMTVQGRSIWANPDLIAAMWMGPEVANGELSLATLVGFATHMVTSAIMGIIAIPFIDGLPFWRMLLNAFAYALASYPFIFAFILTWANPLMIERVELVPMAVAHIIFGIVMGITYWFLREKYS